MNKLGIVVSEMLGIEIKEAYRLIGRSGIKVNGRRVREARTIVKNGTVIKFKGKEYVFNGSHDDIDADVMNIYGWGY